mmetsp:Transcript_31976/g.48324  ORF Transcript_31976/g.48324 Transcript_31976/m.48324 type:complete len:166 (-) Transcript_31976:213-710(-)|eukprot:CAMPEP_0178899182 /NCGR_PEP_ID=MMETSP0786-20121207/2749_1 /TAXON_ID=186022 /ORGANISM="Thalassionema frauenfeldii, Strain CCMP 1798" /LENGTH=165 /DNA_ID=CAMNT_0020569993 /DNA_START=66 /DNA_END=563 /DNA_ORIENTATION=+
MSNNDDYKHGKPTDGMMCLCTMEDITEEDKNYVEYQSYPSMKWKPALFEASVVDQMLSDQFHQYVERVKKTDCQAELKRLLASGPPIYISDKHALVLADEKDEYVVKLWFARNPKQEVSAKLDGAKEGKERQALWDELKKFIIVEGKEDGDDDDNEDERTRERSV